ncbi:MAG: hypothetical protein WBA12_08820 [Catalinimonas sp.]
MCDRKGLIVAGTFYQEGRKIFWDVRNTARTVVVDLDEAQYDQLVIEVEDPDAVVALPNGLNDE